MVRRQVTVLVDDVTGETLEHGERIVFALDGVEYEIDLSGEHAEQLRGVFEPYIRNARRTAGARPASAGIEAARARPVEQASPVAAQSSLDLGHVGLRCLVGILRFIWRLARMFGT